MLSRLKILTVSFYTAFLFVFCVPHSGPSPAQSTCAPRKTCIRVSTVCVFYVQSTCSRGSRRSTRRRRATKRWPSRSIRTPPWLLQHSPLEFFVFSNDPSAGSPTETLLRLHLPLNDKIYTTSLLFFNLLQLKNRKSKVFTGSFNR